MDLNELLHAHQLEVMKASTSGDDDRFAKIAEYAHRIRELRTVTPTAGVAQDPAVPPTIIYGSYAGESVEDDAALTRTAGDLAEGESENPDQGQSSPGGRR